MWILYLKTKHLIIVRLEISWEFFHEWVCNTINPTPTAKKNMSILIWSHMCTNILCNFKDNNLTPWHKKNSISGMWVYLYVVEKIPCPLTSWFSLVSSNCHQILHVPSCLKTESTGEPDSVANLFWNQNELWVLIIYEKVFRCTCKTH